MAGYFSCIRYFHVTFSQYWKPPTLSITAPLKEWAASNYNFFPEFRDWLGRHVFPIVRVEVEKTQTLVRAGGFPSSCTDR